jgi:cyclopropane-fatty-acyl-phospholipid synthase
MMFADFARRVLQWGQLTIVDADGRYHRVGGSEGPEVTIRLHEKALHWRLAFNPTLHVGEAYMDGTLSIEQGSLYDFMEICAANSTSAADHPFGRICSFGLAVLRGLHQYNPVPRAQANVAHHYDLSDQLYDLFLDGDRQYSCAYFTHRHDDLELAQQDKKRHLAAKLLLRSGERVLDMARAGAGWRSTSPRPAPARSPASRYRDTSSRSRASAPGAAGSPTGCASSCATTASRPAPSIASSRSACSNMSACATTMSSSGRCATC